MNASFDDIAKAFARGVSRREVIRDLARLLVASCLALFGFRPKAEAQDCYAKCKAACTGPDGRLDFACFRDCVNSDPENCGHCGVRCPTGTVCTGGKCVGSSGCASDVPTSASLDAASAQLAAGATDVAVSPGGCFRYRRTVSGQMVTSEQITVAGVPMYVAEHTLSVSTIRRDADQDGFFEWQGTATRAQSPNDQRFQINLYSPATQLLIQRKSYARSGDLVNIVVEQPDASGTLRVVDRYQAQIVAGAPAVSTSSIVGSGCSAADNALIGAQLRATIDQLLVCLFKNNAKDIMNTIISYAVSRIDFVCDTGLTGLIATTDWWDGWLHNWVVGGPTGEIRINPTTFVGLGSPASQQRLLAHELLHLHFGEHDADQQDDLGSDFARVDQTETCASLCFGLGFQTKCDCARCLGTNKCDPRCAPYRECDPILAAKCPCPTRRKWYSTLTACAVDCPTGLACFAFTRCDTIDVSCPP